MGFDELLKLTLHKHMVISMVHSRLFRSILHSSLDKLGLFRLRLDAFLLICVMEMPRYKHILGCKFLVLLFVCPNVHQHCPVWF